MTRLRLLILTLVSMLALAASSAALAQSSATDSVAGVQIGFEPDAVGDDDLSTFLVFLAGDLPLKGVAAVLHDDLSDAQPQITGGTLDLRNRFRGTTLTGSFTGGSITKRTSEPGCGEEVFFVDADLDVTLNGTVPGTGHIEDLRLTHFRTLLDGACVTVFATVSGFRVATFTFA